MQESLNLLRKFEAEEKQLYRDNVLDVAIESNMKTSAVPARPILMARTDTFMLFKPAKFRPANKQKVSCTLASNLIWLTWRKPHVKVKGKGKGVTLILRHKRNCSCSGAVRYRQSGRTAI